MREIDWSTFAQAEGNTYIVEGPDGPCELTLAQAQWLGNSGREGGSFRLELTGPAQPFLDQNTYLFTDGSEPFEMFIVPVAGDSEGYRYEAVFN